jgi:hypothetical protein
MSAHRVGTTLLAVAAELCEPEQMDAIILPLVADIQFETLACRNASPAVRGWVRARGYLAFFKAITLTVVLPHGRVPLKSRLFGWLRLLLAIPVALAATLAAHVGVGRELSYLVYNLGGPKEALYGEVWLVKVLVSPFMSAALFWTLYLFAPRERRRPVAFGALILIGLWGGSLLFAEVVLSWPPADGWGLALVFALWLGGVLSYWAARRLWRAEAVSGLDSIAAQVTHGSDR